MKFIKVDVSLVCRFDLELVLCYNIAYIVWGNATLVFRYLVFSAFVILEWRRASLLYKIDYD